MVIKFLTLGLVSGLLATTIASAGTVTFASFQQTNSKRAFRYINQDIVTTVKGQPSIIEPHAEIYSIVGTKRGATLVNFTALVDGVAGSGIVTGQTQTAYLSLDAKSTTAATDDGSAIHTQLFDGHYSFSDVNGANLLSAAFTGETLSASFNAFSLVINGSNTVGAGTLTFTSSVFDLGGQDDFSLAATGLSRSITFSVGHSLNAKSGFSGNLTGNFSTVPLATPEPAILALFGLGLTGLGVARRRR